MAKILFLTYDFPFPSNSGGKRRAFNMMKFGGTNHEIHLFSFARVAVSAQDQEELKKIGIKSIHIVTRKKAKNVKNAKTVVSLKSSIFKELYFDKKVLKQIQELIVELAIDIVHAESFYTGFYLQDSQPKQVFGTENIEYKLYEDFSRKFMPIVRLPFSHQVSKIKKEEKEMCQKADITIAVTEEEADYFKEQGASKTAVIPNGVDTDDFVYKKNTTPNGNKILFVGDFSYFPNRDAIEFFYHDVFKDLGDNLELTIIGKKSEKLDIKDTRVILKDFVDDIKAEYYKADVLISPIRIGGGTNFKLLEAAACGLPILMHSNRLESIGFTPNEEVLVADAPSEFVTQLSKILNNDALQGKLAAAARDFVEKNYSWEVIGKKLSKVWSEL